MKIIPLWGGIACIIFSIMALCKNQYDIVHTYVVGGFINFGILAILNKLDKLK